MNGVISFVLHDCVVFHAFPMYIYAEGKQGNMGSEVRLSRSEKERKILEMWESGHSYREICQALRVSTKTVAKVLRKVGKGEDFDIERFIDDRVKERLNEFLDLSERSRERLNERFDEIENRLRKLEEWRERAMEMLAEFDRILGEPGRLAERVMHWESFCQKVEEGLHSLIHYLRIWISVIMICLAIGVVPVRRILSIGSYGIWRRGNGSVRKKRRRCENL